jgi:hypothetical protein
MPAARPSARRRYVATTVAAVYLAALGVLLLWPDHPDRDAGAAYAVLYGLFPGATPVTMDFGLNVVLFVPFGVVLAVLLRGHPWRLIGVAGVVPLTIEIVQAVFLPGRTSSALDVVANTLGGLIGALSVALSRRLLAHLRTRTRR